MRGLGWGTTAADEEKSQSHHFDAGKGNLQPWEDCLPKKLWHTRSKCKLTRGALAPRLPPPRRAGKGLVEEPAKSRRVSAALRREQR